MSTVQDKTTTKDSLANKINRKMKKAR